MVIEAELEANCRTALKSTKPRTEDSENRSKFNAVTHGMRAKSPVLPGEDSQALEDGGDAWHASFLPRDDAEEYCLEDAVLNSWQLDRARYAQTDRLPEPLTNGFSMARAQAFAPRSHP
jgi:hypothetical protein